MRYIKGDPDYDPDPEIFNENVKKAIDLFTETDVHYNYVVN